MKFKVGDYVKIKQGWLNWTNASGSFAGAKEYFIEKSGTILETGVENSFISYFFDMDKIKCSENENVKYYKVYIDTLKKIETISEKEMERLA